MTRRALTPAQRQARRRELMRAGKRRIVLEVDSALVEDALTRTGLLVRADADDQAKVDAALGEVVDHWARSQIAGVLADSMSRVTTRDFDPCDIPAMNSRKR